MSEMVERMARAIAAHSSKARDCWHDNALGVTNSHEPGGDWVLAREASLKAARAAIEAMRWPTEEMIEAGQRRQDDEGRGYVPYIWQGMIDAALEE
jgi:hypothetical protein